MAEITFTKTGEIYKATLVSTGTPTTIQIQRESAGDLFFKVALGGMKPINISGLGSRPDNFIAAINLPAGVTLTIESATRVIQCEYGG